MSKAKRKSSEDLDDSGVFSDQDFDLNSFISTMEKEDGQRKGSRRASLQKLDDWREARWLREQLQDWEDWDKD